MGKKRILVYTENYLPSIGGLENNTLLLCESLQLLGNDVTLITPQINASTHADFNVLESKSLSFYWNQIKRNDLLIVNGGVSFKVIIPNLLALKPFIIIYQMATLFKDIRNNSLKTKVLNGIRRLLAKFAKSNIGVSNLSFLELENIFGKKNAKLLINPAASEFTPLTEKHNIPNRPFKCLFAGRLIDGKGVKLIIEAVKEINKHEEILHLHFVGDGPEKEFILNQNSKNFIFYHDPVSKEGLKEWLRNVNLTVIPSTTHIEGSPLIMAESLVMGVPVLVSSQPAMITSIKHTDLIFKSGNLNDLVYKLTFLLENKNYLIVKEYCLDISDKYSYPNYLKSLKYILNV
jgi:glycosyltransferase involved in cell wall biosynthesis